MTVTRCIVLIIALLGATASAAPPTKAEIDALYYKALGLQGQQRFKDSAKLLKKVIRLREKRVGKFHKDLLPVLNTLAQLYNLQGDFVAGLRVYDRVLGIAEKAFGPDAIETARALDRVAYHHWQRADWRRATPMLERAMAIHEKVLAPDDPQLATYYDTQAVYFKMRHAYAPAERLFRKSLAIRKKLTGPLAQLALGSYYQLGYLAWERGHAAEAEEHFRAVARIMEDRKGYEVGTAVVMETIARIFESDERKAEAQPYWERAEQIYVKHLKSITKEWGDDHAVTASAWSLISMHYMGRKRPAKALPWLKKAYQYYLKSQGKTSASAGAYALQVAAAYVQLGRHAEARALYRESLKIEEGYRGTVQASTAAVLLAHLEYQSGNLKAAKTLTKRVRKARTLQFGKGHPYTAMTVANMARLEWGLGRATRAVPLLAKSLATSEAYIALVLDTGTESDKQTYLESVSGHVDMAVSLNLQGLPKNAAARELALTIVLQRKGRVLDAVADSFGALHRRLSRTDQEKLSQLAGARSRLGTLVLKGPSGATPEAYGRELAELEVKIRKLEQRLGNADAGFRAARTPVSVGTVSASMPKDTALIEWIIYTPVNPKTPGGDAGKPRYGAYILHAGGRVTAHDLGEAGRIDDIVTRFREALASPERDDVKALGSALDALMFRPLRPHLGKTTQIFVAPDGPLNLVPLGALSDERGNFLLQRYTLTYLTSGRDLIRLQASATARGGTVVVANPTFDGSNQNTGGATKTTSQVRGLRARGLGAMKWSALPGTADEARALKKFFSNIQMLVGKKATESALKGVAGPAVLHIATHGFFLPPPKRADPSVRTPENPLLRSGLALSGANQFADGDEDGVLTALEASGLDLFGTRLVVLSACETGVGAVVGGEGVYGLRRALVIAGSETQVMSLWQVDDESTRDLMIGYYKRLKSGTGRSESLRQAQLRLASDPQSEHPFFWASFITSGSWKPL
ncbi:MAG: CHAT domain-containing protein [Myxococcota bacterium]